MLVGMIRRPRADWCLLIGIAAATGIALICFPLKLPYCASVKAFFGLSALVPVVVFGAWGMDLLTRRWRIARVILLTGLGTWAINSFASMWIPANAPYTRILSSRVLAEKGEYEVAVRILQELLRLHPRNAPARVALADDLDKLGRTEESMKQYTIAWKDHPHDPDCVVAMMYALVARGRFFEVFNLLQQVVREAPDRPDVFPLLGYLFAQQNQLDQAITAYREALRVRPDDPAVHNEIGRLYLQQGLNNWAAQHFRYALEQKPDDGATRNNLGLALMRLGQIAEAMAEFSEAMRLNPSDASPLARLAWIRATCRDPGIRDGAAAVELAERASRLSNGQLVAAWDALGAAYAEVGRFPDAIQATQRAVQLASAAGPSAYATAIQRRLELYKTGQPFRE